MSANTLLFSNFNFVFSYLYYVFSFRVYFYVFSIFSTFSLSNLSYCFCYEISYICFYIFLSLSSAFFYNAVTFPVSFSFSKLKDTTYFWYYIYKYLDLSYKVSFKLLMLLKNSSILLAYSLSMSVIYGFCILLSVIGLLLFLF